MTSEAARFLKDIDLATQTLEAIVCCTAAASDRVCSARALPHSCGLPGSKQLCDVQERRVIEYVALGDYATAVGFLLASTPEKSARYYRDALCTLALAVS